MITPPSTTIPPLTDVRILDSILDALKKGQTFCLSGHQNPDADVVGSQLAMASLISRLGANKKIDILNCGLPPKSLSHLAGFEQVKSVEKTTGQYDVLIVFECSGADRMGGIIDFSTQVKTVINLDHHLHNPYFGHINLVEPTTSSTAELIYKIIRHSRLPLQKDEAVALFTGLTADTGWFRYGNTNPQSLSIAADLLAAGVPVADLAEKMFMSRSEVSLRLMADILSQITLFFDKRLAVLFVTDDIMKKFNALPDDLEEMVNQGLRIDTVQASVFLKEKKEEGIVKISLRSKGDLDINQVACHFGGGGHKNASGCKINGTLATAQKQILDRLQFLFQ